MSTDDEPGRQPLLALSALCFVAVITGTMLYAYPTTLRGIRDPLVWIHNLSGDGAVLASIVYLWRHLARTWRMKRRYLSRYSGMFTVAAWALASASGIYGQIMPMAPESTMAWIHRVGSLVVVASACFHGAYGLRRKLDQLARDKPNDVSPSS